VTHRGPFQPRPFCDSVNVIHSSTVTVGCHNSLSGKKDVLPQRRALIVPFLSQRRVRGGCATAYAVGESGGRRLFRIGKSELGVGGRPLIPPPLFHHFGKLSGLCQESQRVPPGAGLLPGGAAFVTHTASWCFIELPRSRFLRWTPKWRWVSQLGCQSSQILWRRTVTRRSSTSGRKRCAVITS